MIREFFFYLDAWKFCRDNDLPVSQIIRKNWKVWEVDFETNEMES
jgi:hypothetical protein